MVKRALRLLGISDAEWPRLVASGGLFLWVMLGWAMGRSGRDAFFVKEVGPDKLPYMYVLNSVLMVAVAALYARLVDRVARYRLMAGLLALCGVALIALRLAMPQGWGWVPYAVFSLAEVFALFFLMHFWTFANEVFDPREGKRVFPLIGGAGLLGGFVGGVLTRPLVDWLGTPDLFAVWAGVFFVAVPLTFWVQAAARRAGVAAERVDEAAEGLGRTLRQVWEVPLLRTLSYLSVPMWLVVYFVDYQFFLVMDEVFVGQDQLTGFLGLFNSVTALIGLGVQLFISGWVLRRFGVGQAVWVHPIGVTLGAAALALRSVFPVLAMPRLMSFGTLAGVFAKFSDNAIFYSIGESASQLLYNALPASRRGRGRAFISGVVEPASTALAGGLLLVFEFVEAPLSVISFLALGLCAVWLAWTGRLKGAYLRALAANLDDPDPQRSGDALAQLSRSGGAVAAAALLERVEDGDAEVALLALEMLRPMDDAALAGQLNDRLSTLLRHPAPAVRRALLEELARRQAREALGRIEGLAADPDAEVRRAALRALRQLEGPETWAEKALQDPDAGVRAEAAAGLLAQGHVEADAVLEALAAGDVEERLHAVDAVGAARARPALALLLRLCADEAAAVRRACPAALVEAGGVDTAGALVELLKDDAVYGRAQEALGRLGDGAWPAMKKAWPAGGLVAARLAPCMAGLKLHQAEAAALLVDGLKEGTDLVRAACIEALDQSPVVPAHSSAAIEQALDEQARRCGALTDWARDLAAASHNNATSAAALLCDALERRALRAEELGLRCVGLLADAATVRLAAANLRSSVPRVRAEALEVIESSCTAARGLVRQLERRYLPGDIPEGDVRRALEGAIGEDLTVWERACLLYAVEGLGYDELKGAALGPAQDSEEVEKMAGQIERILFLKSVSLFADVAGDDLPWIDEIAHERSMGAGETVFAEGQMGDSLYIVVEGRVRVVKGQDPPVTLAVLAEGDCFGEMAILDGEPRSATVETLQPARFLEIGRDDFERLLLARPQIGFALIKNLNRRLRQTNARLLEKSA